MVTPCPPVYALVSGDEPIFIMKEKNTYNILDFFSVLLIINVVVAAVLAF